MYSLQIVEEKRVLIIKAKVYSSRHTNGVKFSYNVGPRYHLRQENNCGYYYIDEIANFPQKTPCNIY